MTHNKLVEISSKWLKKHTQNIIVPNCNLVASELSSGTISGEIPDVIGWCSWASVLIEIKISRSDFLKDKKKIFREFPEKGVGDFRYYISKKGLISIEEIPNNWGLLECNDNNEIEIVKKAEKQNSNLNCERTILLSIIRRSKIKYK